VSRVLGVTLAVGCQLRVLLASVPIGCSPQSAGVDGDSGMSSSATTDGTTVVETSTDARATSSSDGGSADGSTGDSFDCGPGPQFEVLSTDPSVVVSLSSEHCIGSALSTIGAGGRVLARVDDEVVLIEAAAERCSWGPRRSAQSRAHAGPIAAMR